MNGFHGYYENKEATQETGSMIILNHIYKHLISVFDYKVLLSIQVQTHTNFKLLLFTEKRDLTSKCLFLTCKFE